MTTDNTLDITLKKGEDYSVTGVLTDKDTGDPIDITGATVEAQISHNYGSPVLATFTVNVLDGPAGQYERKMSRATIDALSTQNGVWDMFWTPSGGGERKKLITGKFTIEEAV